MEDMEPTGATKGQTNRSATDDMIPLTSPLMSWDEFLLINSYITPFTIFLCAIGVSSNMVNILLFYKMGFSSSSNISLFCLAIADACTVAAAFLIACWDTFDDDHLPMSLQDVALTISTVYYFFSFMGSWITTVINVERSCCIVFPIKVTYASRKQ